MIVNAGAGDDMYAVLLARSSTVGGFGANRTLRCLGGEQVTCLGFKLVCGIWVTLMQEHEHSGIDGLLLPASLLVEPAQPPGSGRLRRRNLILDRHQVAPPSRMPKTTDAVLDGSVPRAFCARWTPARLDE